MAEAPRFPWRWLFAGMAALVVLCVLCGWWWLHSTGDLDAFEKRARAAGIDLEPVKAHLAANAAVAALAAPAKGVPRVDTGRSREEETANAKLFLEARWDSVLDGLDHLPTGPYGEIPGIESLYQLIAGRIAYGAAADIPGHIRRLRLLVDGRGPLDATGSYWRDLGQQLSAPCNAIVLRYAAGDLPADPALRADVADLAAAVEEDLRSMGASVIGGLYRDARSGPAWIHQSLGMRPPEIYQGGFGMLCETRFGRGPALEKLLAWHEAARRAEDLRGIMAIGGPAPWPRRFTASDLLPTRFLAHLLDPRNMAILRCWNLLRIQLIAAELNRSQWPDDPFAAVPGTRLQRVERDGRLVGAYSVGPNGIDDGGVQSRDICLLMGLVMGHPRMGDPLPPPPVEAPPPGR